MTKTPKIPNSPLAKVAGKAQYQMAQGGAEIIIGGGHPTLVLPEVHSQKWGGECWLKIRHADADAMRPQDQARERSENGKPVLEIPVSGKKRRHEIREGSLKWDVIYDDASALPADGVERFDVEYPSTGMSWHFQSALTAEEINEGCYRPDNIVGSYAIYWNMEGQYLDANGVELVNYASGKYAHLYRPEMVDANGNRSWATQFYNESTSQIEITLPLDWMETAVYPITLDPTFGYGVEGASTSALLGRIFANGDWAANSGTVTKLSAYCSNTSNTNGIMGVYADASGLIGDTIGQSLENTIPSSGLWEETVNFAIAADNFWLAVESANTGTSNIKYDSIAGADLRYATHTYSGELPPASVINAASILTGRKYSIYATYTESGGGTTGTFAAPTLSVTPAISAGTLAGVQSGSFTAPTLSVQPSITAGTLSGQQSGLFAAPSVSVQPVISAGSLLGQQAGNFTGPAVSVQPSITAGTLQGGGSGIFTAPSLTITPETTSGVLTGAQVGSFSAPSLSVQPIIASGILVGQQGGNFTGPSLMVWPEVSAGSLAGAFVSAGAFTAPALSIQPIISAGVLSSAVISQPETLSGYSRITNTLKGYSRITTTLHGYSRIDRGA